MIIGYDGSDAVRDMAGRGNYSRLAIESMAEGFPSDHLLIYTPGMRGNPRLDRIRTLSNVEFRFPPSRGLKGEMWRAFGVTNNLRPDGVEIFHGLCGGLPLNIGSAGTASVVTVADLAFRRIPECFSHRERILRDFRYSRSCRNADHIIALSQRTKEDISGLYGIDPGRISVICQGCHPQFREEWSDERIRELRQRLSLPERFILQTGPIHPRSNFEITVRALSNISPDVGLVAVGSDVHGHRKKIDAIAARTGVTSRIRYIEEPDFSDLPGLNRAAEIVVYPSLYEGYAIPVTEALESGRPVIAASGSCLEETGGPDTLYIDPNDPNDMVAAVHALLSDPAATRQMAAAGKEYALRFRCDTAQATRDAYSLAIERFHARNSDGKR